MADRTPSRPGRPSGAGRAGGSARPATARPSSRGTAGAGASAGSPARRTPATRPGQSRGSAARASRPGAGKERPALAARPRTVSATPPSASTAWVRGVILLGILVMLAVTIVPTLRSLVQQRGDTAAMADKVAGQRETVQQLQHQAALWKDPAYIEVQARERLKFVRVGDRAYTVIDPEADAKAAAPAPARPVVAAPMANAASPWYGKVWQSIQIADRPAAGVARQK
ncbi:septum formation initiator family protein [Terrabacter sp. NPDC080008]|uniref:FtsB family cell division protein n=1 Tax=Terrabacter sp. NPDC080008 TaxID=3155176 RepID=UPI00344B5746